MKSINFRVLIMLGIFITLNHFNAQAQNKADDITGEWVTQKKDGHVIIYKQDGKYYGNLKLATDEGASDTKNPEPKLRNRKINGLVLLQGLEFDGEKTWNHGTIYDPLEGKSYSCKVYFKSPNELNVRGFFGISLFGRTDTWFRLNKK